MALFDKLSKGVSRAAEQARFEADKLMRINKLNSEVGELAHQKDQTIAGIGNKVIELRAAGTLQMPELDELIGQVQVLEGQIAAKKAELEVVKASKFEAAAPATAEAAAEAKHCPNCGMAIQPGTKFCPSCGQKLA